MNILKFKDIVLNNELAENLTNEQIQIFNSKFKGKYTYTINWYYCVALEDITPEQFVNLSRSQTVDEQINSYDFLIIEDVESFIDLEKTNKVNSITSLLDINKFVPDSDITLDNLKMFRTRLADILLKNHPTITYKIDEMLKYYNLEMNDETIKHLTHFAPETVVDPIININTHTCGCQKTSTSGLITGVTTCNPIYEYRKAVYNQMVETFSDISFWLELEQDVLNEIKRYIDNIIKCNLPLYTSKFTSDLYDCGCLSNVDSQQEKYIEILKDLSDCFEFMATENYTNKKNHIGLTLNKWASLLYERMRWY